MFRAVFKAARYSNTLSKIQNYSSIGGSKVAIFNRVAKRKQKDRAALASNLKQFDFLKDEVASRLVDRLYDMTRSFETGLDLGCGRGHVARQLEKDDVVKKLYMMDLSGELMRTIDDVQVDHSFIQGDEEFIPFQPDYLDIVLSCLNLQWVNDLPSTMKQVLDCLRKDSPFLGCLFGEDTLFELRVSLQLAEEKLEGGYGVHVGPMTTAANVGDLLQTAGFNLITIDTDQIVVEYENVDQLFIDLKGMAEQNCLARRKPFLKRKTLQLARDYYKERFSNDKGDITATFNIINFIGWKPDPSQSRPADRGSANISFKDIGKRNNTD